MIKNSKQPENEMTLKEIGQLLLTVVKKITGLEHAIDQLAIATATGFEAVDQRFEGVDQRFEVVDKRFEAMDKRFNAIDQRFDTIDKRFDGVDERLDNLDLAFVKTKQDMFNLDDRFVTHRELASLKLKLE